MRSPPRRRLVMACLCALAIALVFQVGRQLDDADAQEVSLATPRHPRLATVAPAPAPLPKADMDEAEVDPFAPRGWDAAPAPVVPAPAPVVAPVIAVPAEAPPPPSTPSLPFSFMGRLSDGATAMVYLSRGEESWTVKGGETLDGNYKVVSVNPQQIVFEHLPTGTQQTLAIPEADK